MDEQQLKDFNKRLLVLNADENFRLWRDYIVKPLLENFEQDKIKVLSLSEAEVKALILNELFVKGVFVRAFEQAAVQKELEKGGEPDVGEA